MAQNVTIIKNGSDSPTSCGYVYVSENPDTKKVVYNKELLRLYQMDSGLVIDKIVIYTGERTRSYFGPLKSLIV